MSRRVRTLLVGGVLFIVLLLLAITLPVPYVILGPGPTINTLGSFEGQQIIKISGKNSNATKGNLNLTTVSISTGKVSVFQAISGWLAGDQVVVPRETIYPPGQSEDQVAQQDAADFTDSQDSAESAAFCELGYPKGYGVVGTSSIMSPKGALKVDDRLISLDGAPITTSDQIQAVLATKAPGQQSTVVVERMGVRTTVKVTLQPPASGEKGARIGISAGQTCFANFDVTLGLNQSIGGPSAGTMFALGIMEKVGTEDLTDGRFIAGTGTIDTDGTVGPIGGIALKMIAARRAGATVFLAPAGNCADVKGNVPSGLTVAKIATLHGAVVALRDLKAGRTVASCG